MKALNLVLLTAVSVSAISPIANAKPVGSSFENYVAPTTRKSTVHTTVDSNMHINRSYTENGHSTGATFSFKADSIMDRSGDYKATWNPKTQSFGVWAHEGTNIFAVSGSNSATSSNWAESLTERGSIRTQVSGTQTEIGHGLTLEGGTSAW